MNQTFVPPSKFQMGQSLNTTLHSCIGNFHEYNRIVEENNVDELNYWNPLSLPTIMGYVIPEFQRPLVWKEEQSVKFIESLWLGLPVGTYTVNIDKSYGNGNPKTRNILVDGQQRMWAIQQYITDKFKVYDFFYSEIGIVPNRAFRNVHFQSFETSSDDEAFIRDYYNRMNFGGTAHTEDQRA